jgi:hypothetical protein
VAGDNGPSRAGGKRDAQHPKASTMG